MKCVAEKRERRCPHWWQVGPTCLVLTIALSAAISAMAPRSVAAQAATPLFEQIEDVPAPSPSGAHEPSMTSHEDTLYMSWMEQVGPETRVMMAVRTGEGWSVPRLVQQGDDLFVNWADFP